MNFSNYNPNIQYPSNNRNNGYNNYQQFPYQQPYHPQQQYPNQNVGYNRPPHQQHGFAQTNYTNHYSNPTFHKQQNIQYNSHQVNSGNQQVS